ncbi:MAG: GTP-binding protein [Candidatus Woesearchaeota archaeon]
MGVTIITGTLGSGKTTLLKNIINFYDKKSTSLIINDLASVNMDLCRLKIDGFKVKSVCSGCVCCTKSNELIDTIKAVKSKKFLIETTGIAELGPIIESFQLNKIDIDLIITVVDGKKALKASKFNLINSDVIILSKVDLLNKHDLEKAKSFLKKNSKGKVIPAINGKIKKSELKKHVIYHTEKGHKHKSTALVFSSPRNINNEKFMKIVKIYARAKGHVLIDGVGYHFDSVDGKLDMRKENVKDTQIVIIDNLSNYKRFEIFSKLLLAQKPFFISYKQIWNLFKQME